jgi:hypothetical protein
MRLSDAETVDYLGLEKDTGWIVVTLIDDCDWSDETKHLALLQTKINRYFDFIESGEVYDQLERTTGRAASRETPIKISVLAKYEPPGEGSRFHEQVAQAARGAGVAFSFKVLPTGS